MRSETRSSFHRKKVRFAWGVLTPILIYYFLFGLLPIIVVILLSFVEWNGLRFHEIEWVGLGNFQEFFTNASYYRMLFNTILMGAFNVGFSMVFGFVAALFLTQKIKGTTFYRTVWYIPTIVSMAVVSQIVSTILNPDTGVLNTIIIRNGGEPILWQRSTGWMYFWIILVCVWKSLGGSMLLFMAGLNAIPPEIYEAAAIDGVNPFQKLFYITLPNMRQMTSFVLITSLMGIFSLFEPIQIISNGGPNGTTKVIMYQIYDEAFGGNLRMGMSSAISVVVLILVMAMTVLNMRLTKIKI